ncbi:MAG: GFA family protein [Pseudomonadota bacterium]
MTDRTGRCMCGSVSFVGRNTPDSIGVCHCRMCRQWTGSALVGVTYKLDDVTWHGCEHIQELQSTPWAKRGWCRNCGSGLYFQFTADGTFADEIELPIGLFDDPHGFRMRSEIYIDEKPDSYAYAGEGHKRLSRADVIEILPVLASQD